MAAPQEALVAEKPATQEPAAKAPRKRAAPKSPSRKSSSRPAAKTDQSGPAEAAPEADHAPASPAPAEEKAAAPKGGASGSKGKSSAKAPGPGRRTSKKQPPAEAAADPAPEQSPAVAPAPPVLPVSAEAPALAEPVETAVAAAAQETPGEGEPPREKSRRSRSRRGRRKSAAARAAAQARQEGEPAESAADSDENTGTPAVAEALAEDGAESVAQAGLAPEPLDEFDWFDEEDESGETGQDQAGGRAEDRKGKASSKEGKGGKEPEKARQKRKMFVSVLPGEQVEVVLTAEGQVQEYYVEMLHQVKIKGNIYKGVIHNVDANLQAAFVSYGASKNGFLQIDEVHPEYYLTPHEVSKGHKYPLIQKVLKPGQEILVQVVKEPSGSKGAFLTSYLSLAGRFLVLTPGREQIGVSRKVDSEEERTRLRDLLSGLNPGEGLGVIVRTVSSGTTKTNLQKDLQLLKRVWKDVRKKGSAETSPCLIYQELALDTRAVRDYLTDEVTEVWVDDEEMAEQIRELVSMLFPRKAGVVQVHKDLDSTLFERFGLRKQLEQVHSREVTLPSGGRLVFDHTEALMAIDINSGRSAGKSNFEDTAFKTNLEAAQQIPLQLRLRDIGGQIVIDFIEMRDRAHWREVEKAVRNGMKTDRARHDIGKISSFGLMEIVRQRLSTSAISTTVEPCPCCKGTGQRRNLEWQALQALREIRSKLRKQSAANGKNSGGNGANGGNSANGAVVYSGNPELILYLLNSKRERLSEMEKSAGLHLELKPE
ncbi:MAG: Rne/Rng family ribonuclease [Deltaproteobacteria bacterium]|nr:Rne/Rng family ribonuclease [Deltaproteobacteria bacterium]